MKNRRRSIWLAVGLILAGLLMMEGYLSNLRSDSISENGQMRVDGSMHLVLTGETSAMIIHHLLKRVNEK